LRPRRRCRFCCVILQVRFGIMAQNAGLHRSRSTLTLTLLFALALAVMQWYSKEISFTGGLTHKTHGLMGAVDAAARRRGCTAREAVGIFFATQTGNTEAVATTIGEQAGVEAGDVGEIEVGDLADYEGLIVGCPTWNTGADEYRSGTAWDDILDDIKGLDLKGKPVAIFGCGDSGSYGENFCDGIEELHETFKASGAKMVGYVDASNYEHEESKSVRGDKFLGLPLDQDNEEDQTEDRVKAWITQIKSEGMPL